MRRYDITDENWERISRLLPGKASDRGQTAKDNRGFINAVLWIARTGAPWRDLPERFGNWNSTFRRFSRWAKGGHWDRIFVHMQDPDLEWLMLDSTTVRAHQHAAGQKKVMPKPRPLDEAVAASQPSYTQSSMRSATH